MAKEEDLKKIELKVSVNCCEGCKKKVLKALSIRGVLKVEIHPTLPKITVTGNVDAKILIKKLAKGGKTAELWPSETPKPEKEEKKPASITKETGKTSDKERAKEGNINHDKTSSDHEKKPNSNSSSKSENAEIIAENIKDVKDKNDASSVPRDLNSYPAIVTTIPQMNCLVNPNVMVPYPIPMAINSYPSPMYCCVGDHHRYALPIYQSPPVQSQSTGFTDYFNDENTVGCHVM